MALLLGGHRHRVRYDARRLLLADLQHRDRGYQQLRHVAEHVAVEGEVVGRDVQVTLQQDVAHQRAAVVIQYALVLRHLIAKFRRLRIRSVLPFR